MTYTMLHLIIANIRRISMFTNNELVKIIMALDNFDKKDPPCHYYLNGVDAKKYIDEKFPTWCDKNCNRLFKVGDYFPCWKKFILAQSNDIKQKMEAERETDI